MTILFSTGILYIRKEIQLVFCLYPCSWFQKDCGHQNLQTSAHLILFYSIQTHLTLEKLKANIQSTVDGASDETLKNINKFTGFVHSCAKHSDQQI